MWKRFYLILFLFFGFVLFSTFSLNQKQASAHSVDKPPVFSESDKQSVVRKYRENLYYEPDFVKNANIFYFVYKTASSYDKDKPVQVVMYSCVDSFQNPNNFYQAEEKHLESCGSYLKYDKQSGIYSIDIHGVYVSTGTYYLATNKFTFNGFEKQSQYNDFKKIISSSDDPDFYTIYLDQHNKINQFNIKPQSNFEQPNSGSGGIAGLDFGAFAKGIVNGISDFFKPFFDSLIKKLVDIGDFLHGNGGSKKGFFPNLSEEFSKFVNSIIDFFKPFTDFVISILNFFKTKLENIRDFLIDFIKYLFNIEPEYITDKVNSLKEKITTRLGSVGTVFVDTITFFQIFISRGNLNLACKNAPIVVEPNAIPISYDICSVPKPLLILARSVLVLGIMFLVFHRFMKFISILLGSRYVWDIQDDKNSKGDK
jgi:hypothetical protein